MAIRADSERQTVFLRTARPLALPDTLTDDHVLYAHVILYGELQKPDIGVRLALIDIQVKIFRQVLGDDYSFALLLPRARGCGLCWSHSVTNQ